MKPLAFIILFGILTGCDNAVSEQDFEESNVINQTFVEIMGTGWYYEPLPIPPMPLEENSTKEDSIRFNNEKIESQFRLNNRKLDTSELQVYVFDTLVTYKGGRELESILTQENFENNFPVDTSWVKLIGKLNRIEKTSKLDLTEINQTGKYTLVSYQEFKDTTGTKRKIGTIVFSRVAFDENKTRGVFYYSFVCGGLCGSGSIVFVEKIDNKWQIIGQREMWVS